MVSPQLVGGPGVVAQRRHHAVDIAEAVLQRLADIESFKSREFVAVSDDAVGKTGQQATTLTGRHIPPRPLHGPGRRFDGVVDIGCIAACNFGNRFLSCRINSRECSSRCRSNKCIVDKVVRLHGDLSGRALQMRSSADGALGDALDKITLKEEEQQNAR